MKLREMERIISYNRSVEYLTFYEGEPSFEKAKRIWEWSLYISWFNHEDPSMTFQNYINPYFRIIPNEARYIAPLQKMSRSRLQQLESAWNSKTRSPKQGSLSSLEQKDMLKILHESLLTLVNENVLLIPNYRIFINENTFYMIWRVLYLPSNFMFNTYTKEVWIPGFAFEIRIH